MVSCCQYYVPAYLRWAGTFCIKTDLPEIFLSFDDGPSPEVTPFVLNMLKQAKAKATFFCTGENVEKYNDLFSEIKNRNHQFGNHGYKHLNGLKTDNKSYLLDVEKANKIIQSDLFRPPYGKLKPSQYFALRKQYKIIFWTIMTRDFDSTTNWHDDFEKIKTHMNNGTILVFHDSPNANKKIKNLLPAILDSGIKNGFRFVKIMC